MKPPIKGDSIPTHDVLSDVAKKLPVAEAISPKPLAVSDGISVLPGDDIPGSSSLLLPSCSGNHPERTTEHVSECEDINPWVEGRGKRHDRILKSQPALMGCSGQSVDSKSVRPSDDSVNRPRPHAAHSPERQSKEDHARQQCLVIQGLSESNAVRPEDRVSEDLASFHGLLNHLLPADMEIKVLKAFRIGKRSEDRTVAQPPRPLKIMLENKEQIKFILSKKTDLRNTHKQVFFQPDYSPAERLKRRELVLELKSRLKDGEHNLAIFKGKVVRKYMPFQWNQPVILRTTTATQLKQTPSLNHLIKAPTQVSP